MLFDINNTKALILSYLVYLNTGTRCSFTREDDPDRMDVARDNLTVAEAPPTAASTG
jgi:hypothetical protein